MSQTLDATHSAIHELHRPQTCGGRVIAVIPCHNERESVLACLRSIDRDHPGVEALLIDDGSTDHTVEAVADAHPHVTVLRGDGNLWWTGAVNMGIAEAIRRNASHVFLLNNDTTVQPGGIAAMYEACIQSNGVLVGASVATSFEEGPQLFGGEFNYRGLDYFRVPQPADSMGLSDAQWLPGHALIVPIEVFNSIGLPDVEKFPHYWGDVDFTMKASRAGFRLSVLASVVAQNDGSHTGVKVEKYVRPARLWTVLTSQRSTLRVSDNIRFWRTHRDVLSKRQLLRRYEVLPVLLAQEVLDRVGLRETLRRVRSRSRHPSNTPLRKKVQG